MVAPTVSPPEPGTLIAGKYRVDRVLASGGMGVVVEAEHATLGQRVAIKFLLPESQTPELVERFLREARAAARLQSDHVVRVFDIGTDERGAAFMVMELLSGIDLNGEMEARGRLPVAEAVGYVVEALEAIVEAHAAGIVHRDLKPANLFLVRRPDGSRRVKVVDFGISKISETGQAGGQPRAPGASAPDASLTSTQSMLGSPGYMSPEQVRSTKGVDARTDVWALGVILYEMLSGTPAFRGETLGDIFAKIREEDLPPIRRHRPEVPEGLAAVLEGCLQRDREKRIRDAVTLRARLSPFAGSGAVRQSSDLAASRREAERAPTLAAPATTALESLAATAPGSEAPLASRQTLATWTGDPGGKQRSRIVRFGAAIAAAAALGAGGWLLLRPPASEAGTAPPATSAQASAASSASASGDASDRIVVMPSDPPSALPAATSAAPAARAPAPKPPPKVGAPPILPPRPIVSPAAPPTATKKEDLGI